MVYIDSMNARYGRMIMCHMVADTTEELLDMADKIGVQRKWMQHAGTHHEHFDISLTKKKLALQLGAKEIGWRDMANITTAKANGETYTPQLEQTLFTTHPPLVK